MRLWYCYLIAAALLLAIAMTLSALSALSAPECRTPKNDLDRQVCAEM